MQANTSSSFTTSFAVDQSPMEVFDAINDVRGWWSEEIVGDTDKLGGEFTFHFQNLHKSTHKITVFEPGKKVVWHTLDSYMTFVKNGGEWIGTDVIFEIKPQGAKTELHFTHIGLLPSCECYEPCVDGWSTYVMGSLQKLITTGKGDPNKGEVVTDSEKELS